MEFKEKNKLKENTFECKAKSNFAELRSIRFHYLTWGKPDKEPLVLLHGFMDQAHTFDLLAEELSHHYYLIAWDARGFGNTEWIHRSGYYHFWDYLYDLEFHSRCNRFPRAADLTLER